MIFTAGGKRHNRSDESLLNEFRAAGDPDLLGELYSRYMHLVYGVCLKYLKDREQSKDAVMQIFEKLLTGVPGRSIDNFKSWLHVVTKNFCLMQLRAEKSRNERMTEWMNDPIVFMENDQVLHPVDEDMAVMDNLLMECIEKLKHEQKECIRLFYFGNKCYNEIALSMNLDEKKVKSYLQNAKRNLKICLENRHEKEG